MIRYFALEYCGFDCRWWPVGVIIGGVRLPER